MPTSPRQPWVPDTKPLGTVTNVNRCCVNLAAGADFEEGCAENQNHWGSWHITTVLAVSAGPAMIKRMELGLSARDGLSLVNPAPNSLSDEKQEETHA